MKSKYLLQLSTSTRCPKCKGYVQMLCEPKGSRKPWFYICFRCEFVAEIGWGAVPKV